MEFSNSIESIVVESALEARRDGHWLIPRMLDEPRTRKPPLATWLSAVSTRTQTVQELSDLATRDRAYARLARQIRLPALIASCLTILLTFELGRALAGPRVGAMAAIISGSSLLFLEYARLATPDTQLMLWIACCNLLLAQAVWRERRVEHFCAAGAYLALAFMSKGPVALLQTVAPFAAFIACNRRHPTLSRGWRSPALIGVVAFASIALPWPLWMLAKTPGVWHTWFGEITRLDAADPRPDRWYAHLQIFRHMLPWTLWFILGVVAAGRSALRRRAEPIELAFWLLVVPLVVMSVFPERKPRYLLPLIPAAAVLSAWGLNRAMCDGPRAARRTHTALAAAAGIGAIVLFVVIGRGRQSDMKPLADIMVRHIPADARVWSVWPADPTNNAPIDLSIYLNRVVAPSPSVADVLKDTRAGALVIESGSAQDIPPAPAAGATYLGVANRGAVYWHAFALPPATTSAKTPE